MKSKLTEQQKINEVLSKIFSSLIKRKFGKNTQALIKKNPEVRKSVDKINKGIEDFNKAFKSEYGKDFSNKLDREIEDLLK